MAVYRSLSVLCKQTVPHRDNGCIFQLNEILLLLVDASFVLLYRIHYYMYKLKDSLFVLSAKLLLLVHNA